MSAIACMQTLLNTILTRDHGKRVAVIENEVGFLHLYCFYLLVWVRDHGKRVAVIENEVGFLHLYCFCLLVWVRCVG